MHDARRVEEPTMLKPILGLVGLCAIFVTLLITLSIVGLKV